MVKRVGTRDATGTACFTYPFSFPGFALNHGSLEGRKSAGFVSQIPLSSNFQKDSANGRQWQEESGRCQDVFLPFLLSRGI